MTTNSRLPLLRNTYSPVTDFRREIDRLFDDWLTPNRHSVQMESHFVPTCDIEEQDDHYLLTLELAGVKKDDIKMEVIDNQIVISGERQEESRKKKETYTYSERRFGKFQRTFALPAGIDGSQVEANYENGILHILVPKAESTKPRQIKINDGSSVSKFLGKLLNRSKEKEEQSSSKGNDQVAS